MEYSKPKLPEHVEKVLRSIMEGRYYLDSLADIHYSLDELEKFPDSDYNKALKDVLLFYHFYFMQRPKLN
jgi:hypothetical protein